jgi:hypothetical protein
MACLAASFGLVVVSVLIFVQFGLALYFFYWHYQQDTLLYAISALAVLNLMLENHKQQVKIYKPATKETEEDPVHTNRRSRSRPRE